MPRDAPTPAAPADLASVTRGWRRDLVTLAIVFLPLAGVWTYKVFVEPRPFWAHHFDPEAIYLYSGFDLLRLRTPANTDNPATPLQVLTAAILWTLRIDSPLQVDRFRVASYAVAFALYVAAGWLLLRTVLGGLHRSLQVALLWLYFAQAQALTYMTIVSPEMLFFPFGAVALAALWWAAKSGALTRSLLLAGSAIGLCCALKLTYAPWTLAIVVAAAALDASRSARERWLAMLAAAAGCVLGFVVGTLPILSAYLRMLSFAARMLLHSGSYGAGPVAAPTLRDMADNAYHVLVEGKGFYLASAVIACLLLVPAARSARRSGHRGRDWRLLAGFSVTAIAVSHVMVARGGAPRYFLPVGLASILLFSTAARVHRPGLATRVTIAGLVALVVLQAVRNDRWRHQRLIAVQTSIRAGVDDALRRHFPSHPPIVAYAWRSPTPAFALRYLARYPEHHAQLDAAYPKQGTFLRYPPIFDLPAGEEKWDVLVIRERDYELMTIATGEVLDRVGEYLLVAPAE